MAIKRKPKEYECNQAERLSRHGEILERTSKILYGNGTPKDGLIFRFDKFMSDHEGLLSDISEIKININKAIESASTAAHAIEIFKAEEITKDATKDDIERKQQIADELKARIKKEVEDRDLIIANLKATKKQDHWQRVIWIIMAVFALVTVWGGLYFGFTKLNEGQKSIKDDTKVTNEVLIPPGQSTRGIKTIIIDNDTTSTFK